MRTKFVDMVHPNLPGQRYKAPKQGVGALQMQGWEIAPPLPPPPPPAAKAAKTTEAPADARASSLEDADQPPKRRRAKEGE